MLQEILSAITAADGLVTQIRTRFDRGDAAENLRRQLTARLTEIGHALAAAGGPPADPVRAALTQLLARVQAATAAGETWLEQAGAELAPRAARVRLNRAYGLGPRER